LVEFRRRSAVAPALIEHLSDPARSSISISAAAGLKPCTLPEEASSRRS